LEVKDKEVKDVQRIDGLENKTNDWAK